MGKDNAEKPAADAKSHPHAFTSVEIAQQVQEQRKLGSLVQATLATITALTDAEQRMPIRSAQASPQAVKDARTGAQTVAPGRQAEPQSILDFAVHKALDPVVGVFTSDQHFKNTIAEDAKEFLKTAPLFMAGKVAGIGTMVAYATDEVKTSDRGVDLLTDAGLGLAKGGTLRVAQKYLLARNHSPSVRPLNHVVA